MKLSSGGSVHFGNLQFGETTESILGHEIGRTSCHGILIVKRSLPRLDDNFQPTGKRYELWTIPQGNRVHFYKTKAEAIEVATTLGSAKLT